MTLFKKSYQLRVKNKENKMNRLLKKFYGAELVETIDGVEVYSVTRLVPKWAGAQTWKETILIKAKHVGRTQYKEFIRHEMVHIKQWREHGYWFPLLYVWASVRAFFKHGRGMAYRLNKFEIEAYDHRTDD
jgi:hypothetical protein